MLQHTVDGLALGSSYALLGIGFTLVFGVLRQVNLAYGASITFGIFAALWIHQKFQAGHLLLALTVVLATVVAGVYVERLCFAPHRGRAAATSMAATFAVWMQLEELVSLAMPRHAYAFPSPFDAAPAQDESLLSLRPEHLAAFGCAAVVCAGLWRLLYRTRFGLAVRAMVENRQAAALMGIDAGKISVLVFVLASALGGAAGYLIVGIDQQVSPMFAMLATLKGMIAAMLGGLGSLPGAVAGGLLLGVIETHSQSFFGPQYRDLCGYALLFLLLWLRPAGLSALWGRTAAKGGSDA